MARIPTGARVIAIRRIPAGQMVEIGCQGTMHHAFQDNAGMVRFDGWDGDVAVGFTDIAIVQPFEADVRPWTVRADTAEDMRTATVRLLAEALTEATVKESNARIAENRDYLHGVCAELRRMLTKIVQAKIEPKDVTV
jgi:hypothetical protein